MTANVRYSLPVIEIGFDSRQFDSYLRILDEKGIDYSFRLAMNRALKVANEIAEREFKEKRGIGKTTMPNIEEFVEPEKVRLKDVRNIKNARLRALSGEKTSLIHYVLGKKRQQHIGGVAMRLRRKLYVRLAGTYHHKKSFIAEPRLGKFRSSGRRGDPQVFSYGYFKGKKRLFRQTIDDAHTFLSRDKTQEEMEKRATDEARKSFYKSIERRLEKLNAEPLTMKEQKGMGRRW